MPRRTIGFLVTLALGLLAVSLAADGQLPMKVPHVGVLSPQHSTESPTVQREPFAQGLRALGWEPGTSLFIEHRYAEGEVDRLPALAAELVRLPVDVLVARGGAAVRAARQATSTIPIVMSATADPVRQGFVASLARPGGNITGLAFLAQGALEGKRLELLKEAVPGLSRVAFLVNWTAVPGEAQSIRQELNTAAQSLRPEVQAFEVSGPDTIVAAFTAMERAQVGAFLLGADTPRPRTQPRTGRRLGAHAPPPSDVSVAPLRGCRRPDVVRHQHPGLSPAVRELCRQAPQRRPAG